jgi:hypothetical protein
MPPNARRCRGRPTAEMESSALAIQDISPPAARDHPGVRSADADVVTGAESHAASGAVGAGQSPSRCGPASGPESHVLAPSAASAPSPPAPPSSRAASPPSVPEL